MADQIVREKQIMQRLCNADCLYVPKLFATSQTDRQLELRMEFVRGCELIHVMSKLKMYY